MKTPQEWMKQTSPPLYGSAINSWKALAQFIQAIQEDAFESGRVSGRSFELYRVAQILRDSSDPKMETMANSCERLASMIIQSKNTCTTQTQEKTSVKSTA